MQEGPYDFEIELNSELSQHSEWVLLIALRLLHEATLTAGPATASDTLDRLIESAFPDVHLRSIQVAGHDIEWFDVPFGHGGEGVNIAPLKEREMGSGHRMENRLTSPDERKEPVVCLSAPQHSFERLRKVLSAAGAPDSRSAEEHERRGLSMDEILAEVERERKEKGAPAAERLLGVPAHKRHAAVLEGLPYRAFENVQEALGVSADDLARVIGSSERTMRRRKESGALKQQESDALVRVATAFEKATRVLDETRAAKWLTSPHPLLGGGRALDLLSTSAGAEIVDEMLGAIEHGMPV